MQEKAFVQLVPSAHVIESIRDTDHFMVVKLNLPALSQLANLRYAFHDDMKSISKCDEWVPVEDFSLMTARTRSTQVKKKYLGYELCLGYYNAPWKDELGQWANINEVYVVERIMEEIKKFFQTNKY